MTGCASRLVLVIVMASFVGAGAALAQPTIGAYFDPEGTVERIDLADAPGHPLDPEGYCSVDFYAVVHGVESDVSAFGMGLQYPEGMWVVGAYVEGTTTDGCGFSYALADLHCSLGVGETGFSSPPYGPGAAIISPSVILSHHSSWGQVKSLCRQGAPKPTSSSRRRRPLSRWLLRVQTGARSCRVAQ